MTTWYVLNVAVPPGRTRPLCPYPKYAHYRSGDLNQTDSFACEQPRG
jgi:hypothetical protein